MSGKIRRQASILLLFLSGFVVQLFSVLAYSQSLVVRYNKAYPAVLPPEFHSPAPLSEIWFPDSTDDLGRYMSKHGFRSVVHYGSATGLPIYMSWYNAAGGLQRKRSEFSNAIVTDSFWRIANARFQRSISCEIPANRICDTTVCRTHFDSLGRFTGYEINEHGRSKSWTIDYDSLGQVQGISYADGNGVKSRRHAFVYTPDQHCRKTMAGMYSSDKSSHTKADLAPVEWLRRRLATSQCHCTTIEDTITKDMKYEIFGTRFYGYFAIQTSAWKNLFKLPGFIATSARLARFTPSGKLRLLSSYSEESTENGTSIQRGALRKRWYGWRRRSLRNDTYTIRRVRSLDRPPVPRDHKVVFYK